MQDLGAIRDQINTYMPDRETMYEQLVRHQFFMPAESCSICSVKFMDAIIRGDVFMPRFTEIHPVRIAKPPPKKQLKEELLNAMESQVDRPSGFALMQWIKKKDVDVYWMSCILFMLNPNHIFFDKSYSRYSRTANRPGPQHDNPDQFTAYNAMFAGLPVPKQKKKPYVASTLFRKEKPSRMQQMQVELNQLAQIVHNDPNQQLPPNCTIANNMIIQPVVVQNPPQVQMRSDGNVPQGVQVEEEKNELSQLAEQENQPTQLINTQHQPNVIMNQEQVDELADEHLQPKHMTFKGIEVKVNEGNPESPFKSQRDAASGGVNSALKQLNIQSGSKIGGGLSTYEQSKLQRRKNARNQIMR